MRRQLSIVCFPSGSQTTCDREISIHVSNYRVVGTRLCPPFCLYVAFNELTLSTSGKSTSYIVVLLAEVKELSAMHAVVVYVYACVFLCQARTQRPAGSCWCNQRLQHFGLNGVVLEPDLDWGRYLLSVCLSVCFLGGYLPTYSPTEHKRMMGPKQIQLPKV